MGSQLQCRTDCAAGDHAVTAASGKAPQKAGFVRFHSGPNVDEIQILDPCLIRSRKKARKPGVIGFLIPIVGDSGILPRLGHGQVQNGMSIAVQNAAEIKTLPLHPGHIQILRQDVAAVGIPGNSRQLLRTSNRCIILRVGRKYQQKQNRNQQ